MYLILPYFISSYCLFLFDLFNFILKVKASIPSSNFLGNWRLVHIVWQKLNCLAFWNPEHSINWALFRYTNINIHSLDCTKYQGRTEYNQNKPCSRTTTVLRMVSQTIRTCFVLLFSNKCSCMEHSWQALFIEFVNMLWLHHLMPLFFLWLFVWQYFSDPFSMASSTSLSS